VIGRNMLSVRDLQGGYGKKRVLHGVNVEVPRGQIVALLGANGAGKSTLLKTIVGLLTPVAGTINLDGIALANASPDRALKCGVALVPEQRELFRGMSVSDNLRLGAYQRRDSDGVRKDIERLLDVFPILRTRAGQMTRSLSGGEQQMLAIARALMGRPAFLLLDEPSLGLAPRIVEEIFDIIVRIRSEGTAILLVEQNAALALDVANYGYVLDLGRTVVEGSAETLKKSFSVTSHYI
jgi:branched-chain amino acid transport system ATP-binding protein